MSSDLASADHYIPALQKLREQNKYAKKWKLRLERKKNRHPTTNGYSWGWYEIFPIGQVVGYWNKETNKDDLRDVDISAWNIEAEQLSGERQNEQRE